MVSVTQAVRDLPSKIIAWEGCLIHQNRENIAKEFLKSDSTHLLFVDSDMVFKTDDVRTLIKRDKDIIGASCNMKAEVPVTTVKIHDEEGKDVSKIMPDGLLECYAVGTGFMLVARKVFETLSHPWFSYEQDKEGNTFRGEDMWFCGKARKAGFKVYCDPTIKIGHLGDFLY